MTSYYKIMSWGIFIFCISFAASLLWYPSEYRIYMAKRMDDTRKEIYDMNDRTSKEMGRQLESFEERLDMLSKVEEQRAKK